MKGKWINRGLAIVLLLLVLAFIGVKAVSAERLDKLWNNQQGGLIETVLIGGMIGFGALLAICLIFDPLASRRRLSERRMEAAHTPQTHSKTEPMAELAIAPTKSPPIVPSIPYSHEQNVPVPNAEAGLNADNREPAAAVTVMTGYAQHIGEREEQQDAFGFSKWEAAEATDREGVLAVLADGMGGYAMGKEAGQLAVQTMLSQYNGKTAAEVIPRELEQALHQANRAVYELALHHELEWSVGTTLIAVVIQEGQLHWISAGDSRIYLYRSGMLVPLTRDHVYANRLHERVIAGKMTREDAESHPERHLLTSYLGIPNVNEIDANHVPLRLTPGDWVLLCSDGLYDDLSESLMEEAMRLAPQPAAEFILEHVLAQQRPYQDNATIVVLSCF